MFLARNSFNKFERRRFRIAYIDEETITFLASLLILLFLSRDAVQRIYRRSMIFGTSRDHFQNVQRPLQPRNDCCEHSVQHLR